MSVFEPALPPHCRPESDFLYRWSSTFHTCVPTNLAFISSVLGILSILSWLSAQLPQIYKNYRIQSTSGLSIYFLVEWCLGDVSNLLGAIFTRQASWQIIIGGYYCFVDFALVLQWFWYEQLKHGRPLHKVWLSKSRSNAGDDMEQVIIEGMPASSASPTETSNTDTRIAGKTPAQDIKSDKKRTGAPAWRALNFGTPNEKENSACRSPASSHRNRLQIQPSSSVSGPSPRTVVFLACLITLAQASPIHSSTPTDPTTTAQSTAVASAGTILSWLSTFLYLISRLPQLYKNYTRRSTSGLSAHLFAAAFFGNLFYSSSILTNPCAWGTYPANGAGGWVGADGSVREEWISRALPFWLGAAGVLALDGAVGAQFLIYGEREKIVVVTDEEGARRPRWMRVSGWMRGWMPSFSEASPDEVGAERRGLLEEGQVQGEGGLYGATT